MGGGADGCEGEVSQGALRLGGGTMLSPWGEQNFHALQLFVKTMCVYFPQPLILV